MIGSPKCSAIFAGLVLAPLLAPQCFGVEVKLKDLVQVKGVRPNALVGYGLVIGLANTGDSEAAVATRRSSAKLLSTLGIVSRAKEVALGNVASVIVTAELPAFARNGDQLDVRLSANGDAMSLAGGTLLQTLLRAGDGETYVVAQGPVVVGQASGSGSQVLTVARVPQGGRVEREFIPRLASDGHVYLSLKQADFTTSDRIVTAINAYFKAFYATALDSNTVKVAVPAHYQENIVKFLAQIEQLRVVSDLRAKVIVNERTGTVVLGSEIAISPVTIAHGDLSITVEASEKGDGAALDSTLLSVKGSTVGSLVEALNRLGVRPLDLVGIIQALHRVGALNGDLEFM